MIVIIGEEHWNLEQSDKQFRKACKAKAKNGEIILLRENNSVEHYPPSGEIGEKSNIFAAEDDAIHFYADLLANLAIYLPHIQNDNSEKHQEYIKKYQDYIVYLYNDILSNESRDENSIVWKAIRFQWDDLVKILGTSYVGKIEPPTEDLIKSKLIELNVIFKNIAIDICNYLKSEIHPHSTLIKEHLAINIEWLNCFFNALKSNQNPDYLLVAINLRNQVFVERINFLAEKYPNTNIWFIVGDAHLPDLKNKLEVQYPELKEKLQIYERDAKWNLVNMQKPIDVKWGSISRVPAKKDDKKEVKSNTTTSEQKSQNTEVFTISYVSSPNSKDQTGQTSDSLFTNSDGNSISNTLPANNSSVFESERVDPNQVNVIENYNSTNAKTNFWKKPVQVTPVQGAVALGITFAVGAVVGSNSKNIFKKCTII